MKKFALTVGFNLVFLAGLLGQEKIGYHAIRTDKNGNILPWADENLAKSYDHVIQLVWNFWDTMRVDNNGMPYYMNHQVWRPDFNDPRGIGGDQIQMALSSWHLLYQYSGNQRVKDNMRFLADAYLSHSLSPKGSFWPDLPYPYNTLLYSGIYDGDMVIGKNFTQPDKGGSMGFELIELYKMMSNENYPHTFEKQYLEAAIAIANTLAFHVVEGDENISPLPFKVNALTGEVGKLENNGDEKSNIASSSYTTNWSGTMELFLGLLRLQSGDVNSYQKAFDKMLAWMKKYPMQSNKWGPFFEDVSGWSDTQINAMTWARFIMNHQDLFPSWKSDVSKIIDWVYATLANDQWKKLGVTVINEQTTYRVPGNSHTARQAADELLFANLTGDTHKMERAIRQLNWATYWVDSDGKNQFPTDDVWLTDGYGDYVRHYLRAMAAMPLLAPAEDHLLSSTSVIQQVAYAGKFNRFNSPSFESIDKNSVRICYSAFDKTGVEMIRMSRKPKTVLLNHKALLEISGPLKEGFQWTKLESGGVLTIRREDGNDVFVIE
jgi:hypothetical protein